MRRIGIITSDPCQASRKTSTYSVHETDETSNERWVLESKFGTALKSLLYAYMQLGYEAMISALFDRF